MGVTSHWGSQKHLKLEMDQRIIETFEYWEKHPRKPIYLHFADLNTKWGSNWREKGSIWTENTPPNSFVDFFQNLDWIFLEQQGTRNDFFEDVFLLVLDAGG